MPGISGKNALCKSSESNSEIDFSAYLDDLKNEQSLDAVVGAGREEDKGEESLQMIKTL